MQKELSIYQTTYCKTTFLALTRLSYITFNCQVVGKKHCYVLRQKSQQTHDYYKIATKLAKAYEYLLLYSFNKISIKRKTLLKEKFDPTINLT